MFWELGNREIFVSGRAGGELILDFFVLYIYKPRRNVHFVNRIWVVVDEHSTLQYFWSWLVFASLSAYTTNCIPNHSSDRIRPNRLWNTQYPHLRLGIPSVRRLWPFRYVDDRRAIDGLDHELALQLFWGNSGGTSVFVVTVVVVLSLTSHCNDYGFRFPVVVVQQWLGIQILFVDVLQQPTLFSGALFLDEHAHVVNGEDDALTSWFLGVQVDAADKHRVGAVE